ncbi:MAG TPA: hypothetical protein VK957_09410 [Lunatimonas sp.]|nr:hypothetical protein [Lunatimonas sp.]
METVTVNLKRGQTIFENIVEYPLPKIARVKDYVFYFVPATEGYGKGARVFFRKYYKDHITKNAQSLEELIDILHAEIQSNQIDQIREITIVCHANIRELLFPVTKQAFNNEENKSKYQVVRSGTLVNLQEAFKLDDPGLTDFKAKRKEVIKKLSDTSRVTIRACNFGSSRDGLFALYSFFGGRANVYAPHEYQLFLNRLGIGEKSRLKSDLDFYQHLVKQGLISRKTKHSESRKEKNIKKLIDPGRGKNRFELSGYRIENDRIVSGDKDEHDALVESFNQRNIPNSVREIFLQEQLLLSGEEIIQRKKRNEKWIIYDDKLKIDDHIYKIEYTIQLEYEHFSDDKNHQANLYVYPVLNHNKSLNSIPLQLFVSGDQKKEYDGQIFELASYSSLPDQGADINEKANYDAYEQLLDEGNFSDNMGRNILTIFEQESFPLTNPTILQLPPKRNRKQWEIQDEITFLIKEDFYYIYPTGFMTALRVFEPITEEKRLDFFAFQGSDPDTPGTELMAYLDNYSLEELFDLIHFLREAYKEEHAFYIYMAQEAMKRKSEFMTWPVKAEEDEKRKSDPLYIYPVWAMLNDVERVHKNKYAYNFSNVWMEAKASTHRNKQFNVDLFEERKLPFPPEILEEIMEPDSPVDDSDIQENDPSNPRAVPDPPAEFFEKERIFEKVKQEDLSCQQFKEVLEVLKQNRGKSWEELEKIFKETPVGSSGTLYEYLKADYGFNSFALASELLQVFSPYASSSGSVIGRLGTFATSRFVFASSVFFAIAGPLLMMKSLLDEVSSGKENYKRFGTITGLKQGNAMIRAIIYKYNYDGIPIADTYDLISEAPDHIEAYKRFTGDTRVLILMSEFLKAHEEGYKIGVKEVNKVLNEDLKNHMNIFKQYVTGKGLKECHFKELLNSGLIDPNMVKRTIIDGLSNEISKIARYDLAKTE